MVVILFGTDAITVAIDDAYNNVVDEEFVTGGDLSHRDINNWPMFCKENSDCPSWFPNCKPCYPSYCGEGYGECKP